MEENQDKKLAGIIEVREKLRHRAFTMSFELLFVIGLPALAGFFLGRFLMESFGFGKWAQATTLLIALAFSWILIIKKYKKFDRDLKEVNKQINEFPKH